MISVSQKSSKNKTLYTLLAFLAVSVTVYLFKDTPAIKRVQGEMQKAISSYKSGVFSFGKERRNDSISTLRSEIERLNQKMVDYELIKKDNEALKSQFESSGQSSQALTAAKILGFTGDNDLPETLVINVGEKNNIKKGMAVVSQKYLIGKVSDVSENFSVVETVLNSNFRVLAKQPSTDANGILSGKNDFMLFDRISITEKLQKDSDVVTKGEVNESGTGIFPDLIIGKITSITKKETAPFQSAQVMPIVDLSRLTDVFVIVSL